MTRSMFILVCLLVFMVTLSGVSCNVLEIFKPATSTPASTASPTGTIPNAPSNLVTAAESYSVIKLQWWDNSDNEDKFAIVRRTAGGEYSLRATVGAGITTFHDIGLKGGTTYYYRVNSLNNAGSSSWSNEASATTPIAETEYHKIGPTTE